MRLVNTRDLTFKEFLNIRNLSYAIVSHRWGDDEVSYQDFLNTKAESRTGWGWTKISKACEIAREDDLDWVWVDTCCINKDSSAELTEAINSMFQWYGDSRTCYVFLKDVSPIAESSVLAEYIYQVNEGIEEASGYQREVSAFLKSDFLKSEWFRRGWTLQELIAPKDVRFFNEEFEFIGSKCTLTDLVSEATGIRSSYITHSNLPFHSSVAERMRWCSKRQTTREEDIAYCLLGLFDVNMPLLYGEGGTKAFVRLQLEILKKSSDESVFAWSIHGFENILPWKGLLAPLPSVFGYSEEIRIEATFPSGSNYRYPYAMTNNGLEFTLRIDDAAVLDDLQSDRWQKQVLFPLNCFVMRSNEETRADGTVTDLWYASGLAITFDAHVIRGHEVVFGMRYPYDLLESAPVGNPVYPDYYDFEKANSKWYERDAKVVLDREKHPTAKVWKVYFHQNSL